MEFDPEGVEQFNNNYYSTKMMRILRILIISIYQYFCLIPQILIISLYNPKITSIIFN